MATEWHFTTIDQHEREQREIRELQALWDAIPKPKRIQPRSQAWRVIGVLIALIVSGAWWTFFFWAGTRLWHR